MKCNESIEQILDDMDHSIVKKITIFPTKSIMLLALSLVTIVVDRLLPNPLRSDLVPLVSILVLALFTWSFLSGTLHKTYYKNLITNQKVNFCQLYLDRTEYGNVSRIIETRNFQEINKLHKSRGNGVVIKIAYTDDKSICLVQATKYMPFQYALRTEVLNLTENELNELLNSRTQSLFAI